MKNEKPKKMKKNDQLKRLIKKEKPRKMKKNVKKKNLDKTNYRKKLKKKDKQNKNMETMILIKNMKQTFLMILTKMNKNNKNKED